MAIEEGYFDYDEYKKKLEQLIFKSDNAFGIQCSYSVLYCILYEFIKYALLEKVSDFFASEFLDVKKAIKSEKYVKKCKEAGGHFQFAYIFYELEQKQISIIEKAKERRSSVVHEFLDYFLSTEHITLNELKELFFVAKYLDNFFIVNIEIPITGQIYLKHIDYDNTHSVYFLIIEQIALKVFALDESKEG